MSLASLGQVFQSVGDAGNQFADAKLLAYRTRINELLDKLGIKTGETSLAEMQERLRRLKLQPETEEAKFNQTVATFKRVFKRDPTDDEMKILYGMPSQTQQVKTPFELYRVGHPQATYEDWEKTQQEGKPPKRIDVRTTKSGEPFEIVDEDGQSYRVNDPKMPQKLQSYLADWRESEATGEKKKVLDEARKNAEILNRSITLMDAREVNKERDKLKDVARRGIAGHSYLKAVAQEVAQAEATGGGGTTSGDRVIADGFMQLMFGPEAKGIRGSTTVMEVMLKQGGWSDRMIASLNTALSGGRFSQDVRKQILETSERQIGIWDSYVTQFGALTTDQKSKELIQRYWGAVARDTDEEIKNLGGRKE